MRQFLICVGHSQMNVNPPEFDVLHVVWESNKIPMPWKLKDYPWHPCSEPEEELAEYIKSNVESCYAQAVTKIGDNSWLLKMEYPINIAEGFANDTETNARLAEIYKPLIEYWIFTGHKLETEDKDSLNA